MFKDYIGESPDALCECLLLAIHCRHFRLFCMFYHSYERMLFILDLRQSMQRSHCHCHPLSKPVAFAKAHCEKISEEISHASMEM